MRTLFAFLLLTSFTFAETPLSIEMVAFLTKDKEPVVVPPVVPKAPKIGWQAYSKAQADHVANGKPLVVLLTMESCGPCRALKAAIDAQPLGEVNLATVDIVKEPALASLLNAGRSVPQVAIYYAEGGVNFYKMLGPSEATRGNIVQALSEMMPVKAKAKPAKASYSWRVERIAQPRGYAPAYVAGQTYYTHIVRDHGHQIREVLNRMDIRGMSDRDLFALHSLCHSGLSTGYWDGNCYVFRLPN